MTNWLGYDFRGQTRSRCSVIMPGIPDKQCAFDIATTYFKKVLLDAGVRIFRYTPGFVHAKVYVSDSQQAVVGTINTDYRSLIRAL